jgi:hypothetical protein
MSASTVQTAPLVGVAQDRAQRLIVAALPRLDQRQCVQRVPDPLAAHHGPRWNPTGGVRP